MEPEVFVDKGCYDFIIYLDKFEYVIVRFPCPWFACLSVSVWVKRVYPYYTSSSSSSLLWTRANQHDHWVWNWCAWLHGISPLVAEFYFEIWIEIRVLIINGLTEPLVSSSFFSLSFVLFWVVIAAQLDMISYEF